MGPVDDLLMQPLRMLNGCIKAFQKGIDLKIQSTAAGAGKQKGTGIRHFKPIDQIFDIDIQPLFAAAHFAQSAYHDLALRQECVH